MSEYRKELDRRVEEAPPITAKEALKKLEEIRRKAVEIGGRKVRLGELSRRADGLAPEGEEEW